MNLNLFHVVELIKNIVDSVRCTICDAAEGGRARYPCGHTLCDGCLITAEGCMLCLTPPSTLLKPAVDVPFSNRVQNISSLLTKCQDTFNIDVVKRLRVSEQLKAEKELFPDCIQAPVKYCNKRKSQALTISYKENQDLFYPGENISRSDSFKMNKSNNYVQQWLNNSKNNSRKPFTDLNVNFCNKDKENKVLKCVSSKNKNIIKGQCDTKTENKNRKRLLDRGIKSNLCVKKSKTDEFDLFMGGTDKITPNNKNENDESGIVLDEPILIEDSQSQLMDKDAFALAAVEAADKQQEDLIILSTGRRNTTESVPHTNKHNNIGSVNSEENNAKVPFLRKSALVDGCNDCKKSDTDGQNNNRNITVTIENDSFVTTINISNLTKNDTTCKNNSVHVQTEISELQNVITENAAVKEMDLKNNDSQQRKKAFENNLAYGTNFHENQKEYLISKRTLQSPNLFELNEDLNNKEITQVVIEESDSDESSLGDSFLCVTAEVHRSCEQHDYGILGELDASKLSNRSRPRVRGVTPDSNNSSDKENCDPNKSKIRKKSKKGMIKK